MASMFFWIVALAAGSARYGLNVYGLAPGWIAMQYCIKYICPNCPFHMEQYLKIIWQTACRCLAGKWSSLRESSESFAIPSDVAKEIA